MEKALIRRVIQQTALAVWVDKPETMNVWPVQRYQALENMVLKRVLEII